MALYRVVHNILFLIVPIFSLLFMPGCMHRSKMVLHPVIVRLKDIQKKTNQSVCPPINIWIHGTMFINRPLFHKVFDKKFSLNLAIYMNKHFYTHTIAELLNKQNHSMFPLHTMYAFGWSGKLNASTRLEAGKKLYVQLIHLVENYQQKWGVYPLIRIIAHSHGGNVALNLAAAEELYKKKLKIDTLLLLACPVQRETMHYTAHSLFDQIYSLHSSLDLIQIIAPQQGVSRLPFSKRIFPNNPNIIQAKVRLNGKAVLHTQFASKLFIQTIPKIIQKLDFIRKNNTSLLRNNILLRITTHKKKLPPLDSRSVRMRAPHTKKSYLINLLKKNNLLLHYLYK